MKATLIPSSRYWQLTSHDENAQLLEGTVLAVEQSEQEALSTACSPNCQAFAGLFGSLAGSLVGALASAGAYLGHDWVSWLAMMPLIGTIAALVGSWLALLTTDSAN